MNTIEVAAAVLVHEGRVLAARRAPGKADAGRWEFPGGKIEPGEDAERALKREIREELGIDIDCLAALGTWTTETASAVVCLHCLVAHPRALPAESTDHDALRWLRPDELHARNWSAPDLPAVRRLRAAAVRFQTALPDADALIDLYDAVGWSAYTLDAARLLRGVRASRICVSAFLGRELVGFARVVGDGETIAYLQDVLVHPHAQRLGIGRGLMRRAFEPFTNVRQQVLVTDTEPGQQAFYEALGFQLIDQVPGRAFVRYR